jgi:outer membrane lipoprotein-sorting protein
MLPSSASRVSALRRVPSRTLATILAATVICAPASAAGQSSLASGEAVINAMHRQYADTWYKTVSFTESMMRRTGADSVSETWDEVLLMPDRLRIDVRGANPKRAYIYNGDSLFVVRGDSVTRLTQPNLLFLMGFSVYRQPVEQTLGELRALHFGMTPVHEDSWEGRSVFVIGAAKGDLRSRQLWIDRDRLLFLRALQPDGRDSAKTDDYRFDNYKHEPGGWISETVLELVDGKVVFHEEYRDVRINAQLDPAMFDPPK